MAIINLGTRNVQVGGATQQFDPFVFDQTQAYLMVANMAVANVNNIFSFIRFRTLIDIPGQPDFYITPYVDLEIRPVLQGFYFPASSLFRGSGNVLFEIERLPFTRGYGDIVSVDVSLFFDNAFTVNSWRN